MDKLIREKNGVEEVWYSEDYVTKQIELALQTGIHRGIKVEFHAVTPFNTKMVDELVVEFKKRVETEYNKLYDELYNKV